jgi:hypothetical protein
VNIITLSWIGLGSVVQDVECSSCHVTSMSVEAEETCVTSLFRAGYCIGSKLHLVRKLLNNQCRIHNLPFTGGLCRMRNYTQKRTS